MSKENPGVIRNHVFPGKPKQVISTFPRRLPQIMFFVGIFVSFFGMANGLFSATVGLLVIALAAPFTRFMLNPPKLLAKMWRPADSMREMWWGRDMEWMIWRDWDEVMGFMDRTDDSDFNNIIPPELVKVSYRLHNDPFHPRAFILWRPAPNAKNLRAETGLLHQQIVFFWGGDASSSELDVDLREKGKRQILKTTLAFDPLAPPELLRGVVVSPTREQIEKVQSA